MRSFLLTLAILPALAAAAAAQDGGKLDWKGKGQDPVAPAFSNALRDGRPILAFFTSEGNEDCIAMSKGAFSNPAVVEASTRITCLYVECSGKKNSGSVSKLNITAFPTLVLLDGEGNFVGTIPSRDGAEIAQILRDVADKAEVRPFFPEDIDLVLKTARAAGLPVLVYFYDESAPSLTVNRSINDPELQPLRNKFKVARAAMKKGSAACAKYDVDRAPTILVLDPRLPKPEEKPVARISTSRNPRELRRDLDEALAAFHGSARADAIPDSPASPAVPLPKEKLSDDEVDRKFIQARINLARDYQKQGKKDKAIDVLQDVLQSFPKHVLTQDVKNLLEQIKK